MRPILFGLAFVAALSGCAAEYKNFEERGDVYLRQKSYPLACSHFGIARSRYTGDSAEERHRLRSKEIEACFAFQRTALQEWKAERTLSVEDAVKGYLSFHNDMTEGPLPEDRKRELAAFDEVFFGKFDLAIATLRERARISFAGYFGDLEAACAGAKRSPITDKAFGARFDQTCKAVRAETLADLKRRIEDKATGPFARAAFTKAALAHGAIGMTEEDATRALDEAFASYRSPIRLDFENGSTCPAGVIDKLKEEAQRLPGKYAPKTAKWTVTSCTHGRRMEQQHGKTTYKTVRTKKFVDEDVIVGYRSEQVCAPAFDKTYYGNPSGGVQTNTTVTVNACSSRQVPIYQHVTGMREVEEQVGSDIVGYIATCGFSIEGRIDGVAKPVTAGGSIRVPSKSPTGADLDVGACMKKFVTNAVRAASDAVDAERWSGVEEDLKKRARTDRYAAEEYYAAALFRRPDTHAANEHIWKCTVGFIPLVVGTTVQQDDSTGLTKFSAMSSCGTFTLKNALPLPPEDSVAAPVSAPTPP
ncbi:MAG: hypothetical protein U0174_22880 [Polyangiaceae bacterium]